MANVNRNQHPDSRKSIRFNKLANRLKEHTSNLLRTNLLNWAKSQTGELSFSPEKIMWLTESYEVEIIELKMSHVKAKNEFLWEYPNRNEIVLLPIKYFRKLFYEI